MVGNDPAAVRLLSVIFGSLSIPAVYVITSKSLNRETGLAAALFFALSPVNIYLSQLTRTYSLLTLLSILSMILYLHLLERPSRKTISLYAICTALLVYSHVFAWFIVIAQNLHYLYRNRLSLFTQKRWWLYIQIGLAALFFPWFYRYITTRSDHSWIDGFHFYQIKDLIFNVFVGTSEKIVVFVPVMLFLLLTLVWRRSKQGFLYTWLLTPIFVPVFISILISPVFTPKYIFYVSVPIYILLAEALIGLRHKRIPLVVAALFFLGGTISQQTQEMNDPWGHVVEYVNDLRQDEPIALIMDYETLPFSYNYNRALFNRTDFEAALKQEGIYGIKGLDDLKQLNAPAIIFIKSRFPLAQDRKAIDAYLSETYDIESSKTFSIEASMKYGNKICIEYLKQRKLATP